MLPTPFRVTRRRRETADTVTLTLAGNLEPAAPAAAKVPAAARFRPGQFNMLYGFGVGEVPISMSGDSTDGRSLTHTIRSVGAVSRALGELRRGDTVGVRGPFGTSWPVDELAGHDLLVIAGGIGLAPLRPAIYHLLGQRERYGDLAILCGARSPGDLIFRRELERWRGRFDLQVEVTVDHAASGWRGPVGVVTELIEQARVDPADTTALICGPEFMMRFTLQELERLGVPPERCWVSLERNMHCGIGLCGHCQLGGSLICRDGPVFPWPRVAPLLAVREL